MEYRCFSILEHLQEFCKTSLYFYLFIRWTKTSPAVPCLHASVAAAAARQLARPCGGGGRLAPTGAARGCGADRVGGELGEVGGEVVGGIFGKAWAGHQRQHGRAPSSSQG